MFHSSVGRPCSARCADRTVVLCVRPVSHARRMTWRTLDDVANLFAKLIFLFMQFRALFSTPRRESIVLVGGGPSAGKSALLCRLAALDVGSRETKSSWLGALLGPSSTTAAGSKDFAHEDQTFVLDTPHGRRVRALEVPTFGIRSDAHAHPFNELLMNGNARTSRWIWPDVDAVIWVVDATKLLDTTSGQQEQDALGLKVTHSLFAGVDRSCPLIILVNRSGSACAAETIERAVRALAPVLEAHCESHSDANGPATRRAWSVWSTPEEPPWSGRGSLALPLNWLQMALDGSPHIHNFTQRLTLPKDRVPAAAAAPAASAAMPMSRPTGEEHPAAVQTSDAASLVAAAVNATEARAAQR